MNMIKSMTGYGKAEAVLETGKLTIEIKTLNGKNSDANTPSKGQGTACAQETHGFARARHD